MTSFLGSLLGALLGGLVCWVLWRRTPPEQHTYQVYPPKGGYGRLP